MESDSSAIGWEAATGHFSAEIDKHRSDMVRLSASFERRLAALAALIGLASCSYGPSETSVNIENAIAKQGTHLFAFSTSYAQLRPPTGFLNTFPNGGVPKIETREARVYLVSVDTQEIDLVASIPDFAGIPQPKAVWLQGWKDGFLYFRLFGYGGNQVHGDDLSDRREHFYRVNPAGLLEQIDRPPEDLTMEKASGPLPEAPFLRLSSEHRAITIGVDGRPGDSPRNLRLIVDTDTGEPRLGTSD